MQIVTNKNNSVGAHIPLWKQQVKTAIRDAGELRKLLKLDISNDPAQPTEPEFEVFVPKSLLDRIKPGDPNDPILKQVLPTSDEMRRSDLGFKKDPVNDLENSPLPGLICKYPGRALLICAAACPIHCRYCFRKLYPYDQRPKGKQELDQAIASIAAMTDVSEVILSGGDPLMMVDQDLNWLINRFTTIPHIKRLRIHTRFPTMIPSRVTESLIEAISQTGLAFTIVLHVNHPNEINDEVEAAIERLQQTRCNVLNQSVLLRGVNDQIETLVELSERLINNNVMPYYLNQLDRVLGSQHFEVPVDVGRRLVREMRSRLPGYAVPRYVQDVPGHRSKRVLA